MQSVFPSDPFIFTFEVLFSQFPSSLHPQIRLWPLFAVDHRERIVHEELTARSGLVHAEEQHGGAGLVGREVVEHDHGREVAFVLAADEEVLRAGVEVRTADELETAAHASESGKMFRLKGIQSPKAKSFRIRIPFLE